MDKSKKIATIRVIREFTGMGLKDAKDLVENTPAILLRNVAMNEATSLSKKLGSVEATTSTLKSASSG